MLPIIRSDLIPSYSVNLPKQLLVTSQYEYVILYYHMRLRCIVLITKVPHDQKQCNLFVSHKACSLMLGCLHNSYVFVTVWAKTRLVRTCQYFKKYHFKNSIKKPALPWYWSHSMSIIIPNYLLAFVQLTWQVDNDWFSPVFTIYSWNSLTLGQCI